MKKLLMTAAVALIPTGGLAFEASDLIAQLQALDGKEFTNAEGFLERSMTWDDDTPDFVVTVGGIIFSAQLDDGRTNALRASQCPQQEYRGKTNEGCLIHFDGVLRIDPISYWLGMIFPALTIWNIEFQ